MAKYEDPELLLVTLWVTFLKENQEYEKKIVTLENVTQSTYENIWRLEQQMLEQKK